MSSPTGRSVSERRRNYVMANTVLSFSNIPIIHALYLVGLLLFLRCRLRVR